MKDTYTRQSNRMKFQNLTFQGISHPEDLQLFTLHSNSNLFPPEITLQIRINLNQFLMDGISVFTIILTNDDYLRDDIFPVELQGPSLLSFLI